ncbi:hypothetical protein M8C21_031360 [Ambrosia artemisiifolia]|uniref:Uncharacterized protein n=1 Tax=Ambrosia artemisiifolia TaxID=4212 RepID=A0AAD5C141_AMBAR|nr:hypothetical protein M8C21_031360 [Ambrosia artemisiifolia]
MCSPEWIDTWWHDIYVWFELGSMDVPVRGVFTAPHDTFGASEGLMMPPFIPPQSQVAVPKDGPGAPGQSWTVKWLRFDNSYFKVYAEKYVVDEKAFFDDCAEVHAKLSNLGAKFDPPEGFSINDEPPPPAVAAPEKFVAAKYSSGKD